MTMTIKSSLNWLLTGGVGDQDSHVAWLLTIFATRTTMMTMTIKTKLKLAAD